MVMSHSKNTFCRRLSNLITLTIWTKLLQQVKLPMLSLNPQYGMTMAHAENDPNYNPKRGLHVSQHHQNDNGFLNADGGTLFVGVSDSGSSNGLLEDVELTKRKDLDGLENELNQLISNAVSKEISATKVRISFPEFQSKTIAKIDVKSRMLRFL